ncbi:peptidoglycan-binding protein [Sporanaerobium hydrogeniformans]|uniref:Peptidoglycan-binding protein n=1 Tax=Sporanaerobium hydrogeniformans TaxID=3072179 RepID=A0AC61DI47_9FIRM|nr:peptidoglycan-binding protein [Sporanaerobium hydrogeniformans]
MYFDSGTTKLVLPVNPEEIEVKYAQANEKYEVLKLGQVVIPTHVELRSFSFECELPAKPPIYTETPNYFISPDEYLKIFRAWQGYKKPMWFIASNGIGEDISTKVLIESMTIIERAGEEGDKFVTFQLIEYQEFAKRQDVVIKEKVTIAQKANASSQASNPKKPTTYMVQSGDTLWGIAKRFYGNGAKYTTIYDANKDKVKNPNLIRVGQVINIP